MRAYKQLKKWEGIVKRRIDKADHSVERIWTQYFKGKGDELGRIL